MHVYQCTTQPCQYFNSITSKGKKRRNLILFASMIPIFLLNIQCGAVITRLFSQKYSQNTPYSSPIKATYMYVVSFVYPASDWYSVSVPAIIYAISYYIRPHYDGTWLYLDIWILYTYSPICACVCAHETCFSSLKFQQITDLLAFPVEHCTISLI